MARKTELKSRPAEDLLRRYVEIGIEQDDAILDDDNARYNRLFKEMVSIEQELKSRDGDQRRLLMRFYDHPNWQVRLNAAKETLAIAPQEARRQLEQIASTKHFPQAGDAGMSIVFLDKGIFKPR
jgi:hypothetical protein